MEARAETVTVISPSSADFSWPESWTKRLTTARSAQQTWARLPIKRRLRTFRRFAALVGHRADELVRTATVPQQSRRELFANELLPLAAAAQYLSACGARVLQRRRERTAGRPWWLPGSVVETRREPWGVVLLVGPAESPLLLPGVQMLQALAAGNAVLIKPGRDATAAALALRMLFVEAGGDPALVQILSEDVEDVQGALEAGVDYVVFTGATATGRALLQRTAETLTPATLSLSGCDAVFVQADADVELAARAIGRGLTGSPSCHAPRRIFVQRQRQADLLNALQRWAADWIARPISETAALAARNMIEDAVAAGATIAVGNPAADGLWTPVVLSNVQTTMNCARTPVSAPLTTVIACNDDEHALELVRQCPLALGAAVFGEPREAATFARRVPAGCVLVNTLASPVGDPRVSSPAWNGSGNGVTRGPEGLLQMTRAQVIVEQHRAWRGPSDPTQMSSERLQGWLNLVFGQTLRQRWQGLTQFFRMDSPDPCNPTSLHDS